MSKTISDVLEFLYQSGEKELAEVVLKEIKLVKLNNQMNKLVTMPPILSAPLPDSSKKYKIWGKS